MTFTLNGLHTATFRDALKNAITLNWGSDTFKIALFNNTTAQNAASFDLDPCTWAVTAPYTSNEVTGTNWAAGGVALVSPTCTIGSGGNAGSILLAANNVSVATTTLTNVYGAVIYDDSATPKCICIDIAFSGAPYSTNAGTFAVTWGTVNAQACIAQLDITP